MLNVPELLEQAPPLPKPRSRTESFILISNPVEKKPEFHRPPSSETSQKATLLELSVPVLTEKVAKPLPVKEEVKVEPIPERPVDLYKVLPSPVQFLSHQCLLGGS